MSFEFDNRGAEGLRLRASEEGVPFGTGVEPSFFTGAGPATVKGLARGVLGKPAVLIGDAAFPVLRPTAQAVDSALGTSLDRWLQDEQERNRRALQEWSLDAGTTGFAGALLHSLADLGASAALYTPEGAAVLEGYARREELRGRGVDDQTATAAGAVSGAATYVGIRAPITLGQSTAGQGAAAIVRNAGYGGAVSVASGVAERGSLREVLERAGYRDQAAAFQPYDETAMSTEAVLGSLFSGAAAAIEARSSARGQAALDAALTVRRARHAAVDTAPGVPADPQASAAHGRALGQALEQTLRNEPINVGDAWAEAAFVRPTRGPDHAQAREELRRHVADLLPDPGFRPAADAPRGIRNNNPGNVEATADRWEGQTGSDGRFATFATPEAGIRALARTLLTYQERHGLDTVEAIISRWAPARENDTGAYSRSVARALGTDPDTRLDMRDPQTLRRLVEAMVRHENGQQPYPEAVIRSGVEAALGRSVELRRTTDRPSAAPASTEGGEAPADAPPAVRTASDLPTSPRLLDAEERRMLSTADQPREAADGSARASEAPSSPDERPTPRRIAEIEPSEIGLPPAEVREINADGPLAIAAGLDDIRALLEADQMPHLRQVEVTQGSGGLPLTSSEAPVHVVFREGALSGHETKAPPAPGVRRYRTNALASQAVEAFTLPTGTTLRDLSAPASRALESFEATPQADGSTHYMRKPALEQKPTAASAAQGAAARRTAQGGAPARQDDLPGQRAADQPAAGALAQAEAKAADPTIQAAREAAAADPDLRVVLEDGSEVTAREAFARADAERERAIRDAEAFAAAVNCFLRNTA